MHPILFSIGFLTVYSFGAVIALGYLLAAALIWYDARQAGRNPTTLLDLGAGLMLAALLGGRILYILLHLEDYLKDPLEGFRIQHGGLVFYGGLAAALLFAFFFIKRKKIPLWKTLDTILPYGVLVHAFGRIGCFLNGCCYGKPTHLFWGVTPPGQRYPLHPTQLYESFFLFLLFVVLRTLSRKKNRQAGSLFCVYLISYGMFRFAVEFFRGDQETFLWGATLPQFLSVLLVSGSLFFWRRRRA